MKKSLNTHKHLTQEERLIILEGIRKDSTLTSIADVLGKDKSTIGKEIKLHREICYRSTLKLECDNYRHCTHNRNCMLNCCNYIPFKCKRRDRSPGTCDGCRNKNSCRFTKYTYNPSNANKEYKKLLVESREGFNISPSEVQRIGNIIAPLIKRGQSIYMILQEHPEIGLSEKTLYNYIEGQLFKPFNISVLDLRQKASRKLPKEKKNLYKERKDFRYLQLRTYEDYQKYLETNPNATIVEMDTVYNDAINGPFLQTFKFLNFGFLFSLFHNSKTAQNMYEGINLLENILGFELFTSQIQVVLTDRGSEFVMANEMETSLNSLHRTSVFYCDPMQSCQKGSLENNHKELRYILPHQTDLRSLGLVSQDALNLALSHVNSAPKERLQGKTPIQMMKFFAPELFEKFKAFGISEIDADKVTLKPYLLKQFL